MTERERADELRAGYGARGGHATSLEESGMVIVAGESSRHEVTNSKFESHSINNNRRYVNREFTHNDNNNEAGYYYQSNYTPTAEEHAAARTVQKAVRKDLVSTYWTFLLQYFVSWTISIQAIHRGRRARFCFNLLRDLVSKSQALVRGWLVRRAMHAVRKERLTAYRAQVFELWRRSYTPLSYRVRFWTYINRYRFLHLSLHEEELLKLWEALGLKRLNLSRPKHERERLRYASPNQHAMDTRNCHLFMEERFGYRSQVIQKRFLIIQRKLESVKMEHRQLDLLPVFPTEFALCKDVTVSLSRDDPTNNLAAKTDNLRESRAKLEQERENMYRALKQCKKTHPETWTRIFTSMKIPVSVQQKKRKVVKLLWEHPAYAKTSLQVYFMTEGPNRTTGQQGGTGGSGLTTEYSAKILNARRAKWRLEDDLLHKKSIRRLRLERKGVHFRLQRRSIVAGMKVTDWMDQRAILILGYLYMRAGEGRYDPLAARMMLLRRMNVRRKRIREHSGTSQPAQVSSRNSRSVAQQTATSSIQLSHSTANTPNSLGHTGLGSPHNSPTKNVQRTHMDDGSTGGESSSHASRSTMSQKIKDYLLPKKGDGVALQRTKSYSNGESNGTPVHAQFSKSTSPRPLDGTRRTKSITNNYEPLHSQHQKGENFNHYGDEDLLKESMKDPNYDYTASPGHETFNKSVRVAHLDKLERELLSTFATSRS